jgi:hypothetical protein
VSGLCSLSSAALSAGRSSLVSVLLAVSGLCSSSSAALSAGRSSPVSALLAVSGLCSSSMGPPSRSAALLASSLWGVPDVPSSVVVASMNRSDYRRDCQVAAAARCCGLACRTITHREVDADEGIMTMIGPAVRARIFEQQTEAFEAVPASPPAASVPECLPPFKPCQPTHLGTVATGLRNFR